MQLHYTAYVYKIIRCVAVNEQLDSLTLATCTAEIVAAFVSAHSVANTDVPHLIDPVARNLSALGVKVEPNPTVS